MNAGQAKRILLFGVVEVIAGIVAYVALSVFGLPSTEVLWGIVAAAFVLGCVFGFYLTRGD